MANWSRREIVTCTVEYSIPSGDAIGEFMKAYSAARMDYRERHGLAEGPSHDDWARVEARDEDVVIVFGAGSEEGSGG